MISNEASEGSFIKTPEDYSIVHTGTELPTLAEKDVLAKLRPAIQRSRVNKTLALPPGTRLKWTQVVRIYHSTRIE